MLLLYPQLSTEFAYLHLLRIFHHIIEYFLEKQTMVQPQNLKIIVLHFLGNGLSFFIPILFASSIIALASYSRILPVLSGGIFITSVLLLSVHQ